MDESLSQAYIAQERQRFERQRRIAYCVAGAFGALLILYDLLALLGAEGAALDLRWLFVANDLVFALAIVLIVWAVVAGKIDLDRVERWSFYFCAFQSLIFNSLLPALSNGTLQQRFTETIGDDIWFLLVICAMAMHVFPARRGALLAVALYGGSALIVLAEVLYQVRQGGSPDLAWRIGEIYGMGGALLCFLYVLARYRDNAQRLQVRYEILEHIAYIDPLTSLSNRRRLYEMLMEQQGMAARYGQAFSAAIWDIDHFKRVNDQYGHDAGDRVLAQVAGIVRDQLRTTDHLGRWGGEEFLIILPQTGLASAHFVAERLCHVIGTSPVLEGDVVTASFGVAEYQSGESVAELLKRADEALYVAKAEGRNRVRSSGALRARAAPLDHR